MKPSSIDGSRLTLVLAAASAGPAKTADWATGQLLRAIVDSQSPDGTVTLRLGTQLLEGRSDLPLRPGQSLTLQVTQTGTPLVLRIVPEAATAPAPMTGRANEASRDTVSARGPRLGPIAETATGTDGINRALRQALPRQGEIQPLLDGLVGAARGAPGSLLPPAVAAFANRLLSRLPDIQTLVAPGALKQALRDSGLFLEAHLARNSAAPERDLKAMLLRLQGMLRNVAVTPDRHDATGNSPPTPDGDTPAVVALQQRTDAALARIVMNQIDSLPRDTSAAAIRPRAASLRRYRAAGNRSGS